MVWRVAEGSMSASRRWRTYWNAPSCCETSWEVHDRAARKASSRLSESDEKKKWATGVYSVSLTPGTLTPGTRASRGSKTSAVEAPLQQVFVSLVGDVSEPCE